VPAHVFFAALFFFLHFSHHSCGSLFPKSLYRKEPLTQKKKKRKKKKKKEKKNRITTKIFSCIATFPERGTLQSAALTVARLPSNASLNKAQSGKRKGNVIV
jgi:hypothetical protein